VSELETAKEIYAAVLGVPPQTDGRYYVGFEAAGSTSGWLRAVGPQGMTSPVAYWHVPDIAAKLADAAGAGATVKEPAHDVGGGRLVATSPTRWQHPRTDPGPMRGLVRRKEVFRNG
jgi:predicted enzyme related to lactoylglutathione lyase